MSAIPWVKRVPVRSESERQALVRTLLAFRKGRSNLARQREIENELRRDFELGWPEGPPSGEPWR